MKKRVKKILFTSFAILIFQISFSQQNYLPGYIISPERDTISGFIDYKNWNINPNKIKFKIKKDSAPIFYNPNSIIEFGVKDEIYVSAIVNTETSPIQTNRLQEYSKLNLKLDTIFIQTLFKGSKSLYFYKSNKGKDNFYLKRGPDFELLIYKKYTLTFKDKLGFKASILKENKKFKGQLAHYFDDCSTIQSKLKTTEYTQNSLEKLFKYYYNCSQKNIQFQKNKEKTVFEIGILAGVSSSKLEFKGDNFDYLTNAKLNQSKTLTAGIFMNVFFSRNRKKWSVNNEIVYSSSTFEGKHESFRNETGEVKTTTELGYTYLKLNNLLRYYIPLNQKSLRLFINGGISNGLAFSEKNYKKQEIIFFGNERKKEGKALDKTRKYEQSYLLGIGLKHNKISLETRLEKGNGMSEYARLSSPTTRFNIYLGYRF